MSSNAPFNISGFGDVSDRECEMKNRRVHGVWV
jgi:hypothetical protein